MLEYSVYANSSVTGHMAVFWVACWGYISLRIHDFINKISSYLFFVIIVAESYYWNHFEFQITT